MFLHFCIHVYMFADDVKCARPISSHEDGEILQANLNSLCSWERQWKMSFKVSKSTVLHCTTGKTPVNFEYELNGVLVKTSNTYKDIGVFFSADLSFTTHYNYITTRVYRMLGLIRRTFTTKTNIQERSCCTSVWCAHNYYTAQFCGDHIYSKTLSYLNGCRGEPPNTFSMISNQITRANYWH